jgi:transposase InsO family protein
LGQPRSSQRYQAKPREEERRLIVRMHELVGQHPRFGYRRITVLLRREGWRVNRKRVYRLWLQEGFKVPQKQRKKRRLGHSGNSCVRRRAERKNHVWTWDFIFDRTTNGRSLKWLSIIDEHTRECLALEVNRRMTSDQVIDVLVDLFAIRGVPEHIRSDNGPEFIAVALRRWLQGGAVQTLYVEPGAPWENGFAESFHSRLRDELLDREEFTSVAEAKQMAAWWQADYNHRRPHSSLGYRTPAEFAAAGKRWGGSKKGRRLKVTPEQEDIVRRLHSERQTITAISKGVGLSRPTVYAILADGKPAN